MKPEADATTKYWVTAAPCPRCLAFAGDLPRASRRKAVRSGGRLGWGAAAGAQARPGAAWTSAARHRARFPAEEESRGSTARGRPPSAEEAAKLTHRRCPRGWGSPAEGQQLGEWRLSPKGSEQGFGDAPPVPCRLFAGSRGEEIEAGAFKTPGRTLGEKKSRSQAPRPCCLP